MNVTNVQFPNYICTMKLEKHIALGLKRITYISSFLFLQNASVNISEQEL